MFRRITLFHYFLFLSLSVFAQVNVHNWSSSGMLGQSGMVIIPTAHLNDDRTVSAGWSYIPQGVTVRKVSQVDNLPEFVSFARINFLPFIELSIRFTKTEGVKELGDRSVFARIQVLKEKKNRPAFAVGAHDLFGQVPHYHSLYGVISKQLINKNNLIVNGHVGYGLKARERVRNSQLIGLFGGATVRYRFVEVGMEYDGEKANAALKLFYRKWVSVSINLLDFNQIGGGAAIYFQL